MIKEIQKNGFKWHYFEFEFGNVVEVGANSSGFLRVATLHESDLAVAQLVQTPDRFDAANLAGFLDCTNVLSMLNFLKERPANFLTIFQCFTLDCWILWAIGFFAFQAVFMVLRCFGRNHIENIESYRKVLLTAWSFLAFFFEIVFTNDMLANLTTPTKFAIDTLDELMNDKSVSVLIDPRGYLYQTLLKSLTFQNPVKFISNHEEVIKTMLGDNLVYVRGESSINLVMKNYPFLPLHKGESKYLTVTGSLVSKSLSRNLHKRIASMFASFQESGLFRFWLDKGFFKIGNEALNYLEDRHDAIELFDVRIAFILLTSAYLIAGTVFAIELMYAPLLLFLALRNIVFYYK